MRLDGTLGPNDSGPAPSTRETGPALSNLTGAQLTGFGLENTAGSMVWGAAALSNLTLGGNGSIETLSPRLIAGSQTS